MKNGFTAIEIAPTKLVPEAPYDHIPEAKQWYERLRRQYGFLVSSMQSIWFGRQEQLFGSEEERKTLLSYTQKAIDFASALECGNLVFGCPKNRSVHERSDYQKGIAFFEELGEYAAEKHTVIGIESNPAIYHTNYLNDTAAALELIRAIDSPGIRLNLDVGTMLANQEDVSVLRGQVRYISHVHISEPYLAPIQPHPLHEALCRLLTAEGYTGYISVEMKQPDHPSVLMAVASYVGEVFG